MVGVLLMLSNGIRFALGYFPRNIKFGWVKGLIEKVRDGLLKIWNELLKLRDRIRNLLRALCFGGKLLFTFAILELLAGILYFNLLLG